MTMAGDEPDTRTTATGHDAETIMLDFVNPAGPTRRGLGRRGQARLDYPQLKAGTLTQRHACFKGNGRAKSRVGVASGLREWGLREIQLNR